IQAKDQNAAALQGQFLDFVAALMTANGASRLIVVLDAIDELPARASGDFALEHLGASTESADRDLIRNHVVRVEIQADQLVVELKAAGSSRVPPSAVNNERPVVRIPWKKAPMKRRRPQVSHSNPRKCPQTAGFSSETGKRRFASDCVVGPGGVHPHCDFKDLACPAGANEPSDYKRQFPQLSSRVHQRGLPAKHTVTTKQAEARDTA